MWRNPLKNKEKCLACEIVGVHYRLGDQAGTGRVWSDLPRVDSRERPPVRRTARGLVV